MNMPTISISVEREAIPVATMSPESVPDESWRYVDSKGHGHFWDGKDLPTLREVVIGHTWVGDEYDGEEVAITEFRCRQCGEVIEPQRRSEYAPSFIPGLATVTLTVDDETFVLTPEEYAASVESWRKTLRGMR